MNPRIGIATRFTKANDLLVIYGESYQLVIPEFLPVADDEMLKPAASKLLGSASYLGPQKPKLIVVILEKAESSQQSKI